MTKWTTCISQGQSSSSLPSGHWKIDPTTSWKMSNVKTEERHFPCPICHKIFRSRGSLSSHKYSYHKEFSTSSQPILQRQMNPLTQPNPLQLLDFQMDTNLEKDRDIECPICHKFFSTRGSLATHKYNYHRNNVNVSFNNPMQQWIGHWTFVTLQWTLI